MDLIHQYVKDGNLQQVEKIVSNVKSKFYLNSENESALYTAIQCKKFQIYAFLKSIGAEFKSEDERAILKELTFFEKQILEEQQICYFRKDPQAHINYLISKSRSSKEVPNFTEKVKNLYETLEQIPEISIILQVIPYSDYLDVVFDFDNENITGICPHASDKTRGQTNYKDGRLYIAAGQNQPTKILGTLAHELMHMAMEIVFENDCDPYFKYSQEKEKQFNEIAKITESKFRHLQDDISKVIMEGFSYEKADHNSELIVRVLQIIVQFSEGKQVLLEEAADLMNYFDKIVLAECRKFINDGPKLKIRRQIRNINEQLGEIRNIQKGFVSFVNVTHVHKSIKDITENVMLVKGKSPWVSLLRTLQALYGKEYKHEYSKYIVVKFDVFVQEATKILRTLFPEAGDTLFIYCAKDSQIRTNLQEEAVNFISKLLDLRPDKKVIFAIHNDMECDFKRILKLFNISSTFITDENITLTDLDDASQKLVLNKLIYFQGEKISISSLVKNDVQIKRLIDAEAIADILLNQEIEVGNKSNGLAGLDTAYADLQEEINTDLLIDMLENPESKTFVVQEMNPLSYHVVPSTVTTDTNFAKIEKIYTDHSERKYFKKVKENYTDKEFKQLCQNNPEKDVYWIQDNKDQVRRLLLRKLYTPKFYIERKFSMYKKIAIKIKDIEELSKYNYTTILISNTTAETFVGFYKKKIFKQQHKTKAIVREKEGLPIKPNISKIIFAKNEEEARKKFEKLSKSSVTIYWLEMINNNLLYKQSQGPLSNLRKHIDEESSVKYIAPESCFFKNFKNEKVFITSDDPGMGKSTTITKLCYCEFSKTNWIIKIDLKDNVKNVNEVNNIQNLVTLVTKTNGKLNNHMAAILLQAALDKNHDFFKPLLIVFDGFDEVPDKEDREKIIRLLKFINEKTKASIIVTTRPHLKEILENNLSTFAFEFQPMDSTTKKEFVMSYFKIRFNLIFEGKTFEDDRFSSYSQTFVSEIERTFEADTIKFVGTPLQMYLLLELTAENFKNWIKSQNCNEPITFNLGKDILEVYCNFINKKYDFYKKKSSKVYSSKDIISLCEKFHMQLAKEMTLNSNSDVFLNDFERRNPNIPLACGIVKCENNRLKFIHPTFQEYYAAKLFISWLEKKDQRKKKLKTIFQSIFVNDNFIVIRNFLECRIQDVKVSPENKVKSANILLEILQNRKINDKPYLEIFGKITVDLTCLDVAIREEHVNIFNFVINLLLTKESTSFLNIKCRYGDSVLMYACRCNRKRIVESIFEICERTLNPTEIFNLICLQGQSKETCLHHAAFHHNTEILKLLLEKTKTKAASDKKFYNMSNLKDDYDNTILHAAASFTTLVSESGNIIPINETAMQFSHPELPYMFVNKDPFELRKKHDTTTKYVSELRKEGHFGAISTTKIIIDHFSENKTGTIKMLRAKNKNRTNVMHEAIATGDTDFVQFIADKMEELNASRNDMYDLLFAYTIDGENFLDIWCANGDVTLIRMIVNLIKQCGGTAKQFLLPKRSKWTQFMCLELDRLNERLRYGGQNPNGSLLFKNNMWLINRAIFICVENRDLQGTKAFLKFVEEESSEILYKYLTLTDESNTTAFSLAVESDNYEIVELILENVPRKKLYSFVSLLADRKYNVLHLGAMKGCCFKSVSSLLRQLIAKLSTTDFQKYLLSKGQDNNNAFHHSVEYSHYKVFLVLLEYAAKSSPEFQYECLTSSGGYGRNAFHYAVQENYVHFVQLILENIPLQKLYTFVSLLDCEENNALLLGAKSVYNGRTKIVVSLILKQLKAGISVKDFQKYLLSKDRYDCNVFHISAGRGHFDVFSVLLQSAAELSPEFQYECLLHLNNRECTPLHLAVINNHRYIVEFILKKIPGDKVHEYVSLENRDVLNALIDSFETPQQIEEAILAKISSKSNKTLSPKKNGTESSLL